MTISTDNDKEHDYDYPEQQEEHEEYSTHVTVDDSGTDWAEVWRVTKPAVCLWLSLMWLLLVFPNAFYLEGFIEVLRELPPIMMTFFFLTVIWMFYSLGKDILMVWFWFIDIVTMLWVVFQ